MQRIILASHLFTIYAVIMIPLFSIDRACMHTVHHALLFVTAPYFIVTHHSSLFFTSLHFTTLHYLPPHFCSLDSISFDIAAMTWNASIQQLYCNRAASYSLLKDHASAVKDRWHSNTDLQLLYTATFSHWYTLFFRLTSTYDETSQLHLIMLSCEQNLLSPKTLSMSIKLSLCSSEQIWYYWSVV